MTDRNSVLEEAAKEAEADYTPAYGPDRADMESLAERQRRNIAERIRALKQEGVVAGAEQDKPSAVCTPEDHADIKRIAWGEGYAVGCLAEKALREALTPSGDTKAAYIGEFSFGVEMMDKDGDEYMQHFTVPWTTIKEIMAAIKARALSTSNDSGGK